MSEKYTPPLFSVRSLVTGHLLGDDNHHFRKIPGLGISILESGGIYWGSGRGQVILRAPAIYWVWEEKTCTYGAAPGLVWDNQYVHITGDAAGELVRWGLFPACDTPYVTLPPDSEIFTLFHTMADIYREDPAHSVDRCMWYIIGIGLELRNCLERPARAANINIMLAELRREIFANPTGKYDFDAMAARFRITPRHFARRFYRINRMTPHNAVIQARLRMARKLLLNNCPVKEAAVAAGFCSASYFSRMFKKYYSCPPAVVSGSRSASGGKSIRSRRPKSSD